MFLTHRPTTSEIEKFVRQSSSLPLSYHPIGLAQNPPPDFSYDSASAVIGRGRSAFRQATQALRDWRQFALGWVELYPAGAPVEPGTEVVVMVHHLGLWSLNGCRIVYSVGDGQSSFGFAYGTLTNHAEMGEEIFELSMSDDSHEIVYRIRAVSKPRATLARIGYPYTRLCQARFRRDSIAAMRRAAGTD